MKVEAATNDQIEHAKSGSDVVPPFPVGGGMQGQLVPLWLRLDDGDWWEKALILRIEQEVAERAHENDVGATDLEHKQIAQEGLIETEAEIARLRGLLELREAKLLYYENAETCSDSLPNDAVAKFVKDVQRLQPTDAYKMVDACFREMRAIKSEIPMEAE